MKKSLILAALALAGFSASALADDITVNVSYNTGSVSGTTWTSSSTPTVTVSVPNGGISESDGNLVLATTSGTRTVTIATTDVNYFVSAISMNVTGYMGDAVIFTHGETAFTSSNDVQAFSATFSEGETASFTIATAVANNNKKATCGNFVVTLSERTGEVDYKPLAESLKNQIKGLMQGAASFLSDGVKTSTNASFAGLNVDDVTDYAAYEAFVATANGIKSAVYEDVNGKVVTIKNIRCGKYLSSNTNHGGTCTTEYIKNDSQWVIRRHDSNNEIRLFNTAALKAIGNNPANLVNEGQGQLYEIDWSTGNNGTAFRFSNGTNGLNCNGNGSAIENWGGWGQADGGAAWYVQVSGSSLDDIVKDGSKYYRIRSSRALAMNVNNLVAINTTVENGVSKGATDNVLRTKADGLGALWTIHEAADGKVIIRNAAAEYQGEAACYGIGDGGNVTANPVAVTICNANESNFNKNLPFALAIRTSDEPKYLDTQNHGDHLPAFNGWEQVDNSWPGNGGIYFFELVDDQDVEALKQSYIANVSTALSNGRTDFEAYKLLPQLFSEADVDAATANMQGVEATSVATANDAVTVVPNAKDQLFAKVDGKIFTAENIDRAGCPNFLAYKESVNKGQTAHQHVVGTIENGNELAAMWILEHQAGQGYFFLKNYLNNRYAGYNNNNDTPLTTSETNGTPFELLGYLVNEENVAGIKNVSVTSTQFMHQTGNDSNDYAVRWNAPSNSPASGWRISVIEEGSNAVASLKATGDKQGITISAENTTLSKHDVYGTHHNVVLSQAARTAEEPITLNLGDNKITENTDGSIRINYFDNEDQLDNGSYIVTVPTAAFKTADGRVSAPAQFTLTVSNDGVTGISEIEGAANGADAIFDLQGRRVAKALKGIYIINGKKTLVK